MKRKKPCEIIELPPFPFDFNRFKTSPEELAALLEDPLYETALTAKFTELRTLFKHQLYRRIDPTAPTTFLLVPETAFILSAKILELKATFRER